MNREYAHLKELGKKLSEITNLPVQEEKKKLWIANNDLKPIRPMVYMDQLPWHEINTSDEMKLLCENEFLRSVEYSIRQLLYRWKHFPCDMVVENRIDIPHAVHNVNYGIHIVEETRQTDAGNDVVSHKYKDQIATEEDLNALQNDEIRVDRDLDRLHMEQCQEIFDSIIPVRFSGVDIHAGVWDRIAQMRPAQVILEDMIDRPEFMQKIVEKFVSLTMSTVEQCEALGLLDPEMQYVHCTGAYTNDLPPVKEGQDHPAAKNIWAFGMAQLFTTMSPAMHEEFEIDIVRPLYERFGLLYYGCCEPLENKIGIIRKLKNVRKISVSPWANVAKSAENMHGDFVLSLKPNPAFFVAGFAEDKIVKLVRDAIAVAKANNTPIEIIQKDVSTLEYHLDNLDRWEQIVMRIVQDI
ncbi:hypothetical protein [Treponema primitia]|uniref:hypothetical protein n=1 Tax=Treponema primitia TaxID=88058 RepID=UPI00025555E0|nr:hypothetical protein [Treponema primitia]